MKNLSTFLFLLPLLLLCQERVFVNNDIETKETVFKSQVESKSNGSKFADSTIESTVIPGSLQHFAPLCSDLKVKNNVGVQFQDETIKTSTNAPLNVISNFSNASLVIEGLQDTISLISVSMRMTRFVEMTTGEVGSDGRILPQWDYVSCEREADDLSDSIKRLLMVNDPKDAEIFTTAFINGSIVKVKSAKYTDISLSFYEESSGGGENTEVFQFAFQAVSYCILRSDGSTDSVCYDLANGIPQSNCDCNL